MTFEEAQREEQGEGAYEHGRADCRAGLSQDDNPYEGFEADEWANGWLDEDWRAATEKAESEIVHSLMNAAASYAETGVQPATA